MPRDVEDIFPHIAAKEIETGSDNATIDNATADTEQKIDQARESGKKSQPGDRNILPAETNPVSVKQRASMERDAAYEKTINKIKKLARKKVYEALVRSNDVFVERYTFNTMIAGVMEAMNALNSQSNIDVWSEGYWILTSIMEPVIPHTCWEISDKYFSLNNLSKQEVLEEVFVEDSLTLGISINGKRRGEVEVDVNATKEEILIAAKKIVAKWLEDKTILKEIVVPKKLVNLVIKG